MAPPGVMEKNVCRIDAGTGEGVYLAVGLLVRGGDSDMKRTLWLCLK